MQCRTSLPQRGSVSVRLPHACRPLPGRFFACGGSHCPAPTNQATNRSRNRSQRPRYYVFIAVSVFVCTFKTKIIVIGNLLIEQPDRYLRYLCCFAKHFRAALKWLHLCMRKIAEKASILQILDQISVDRLSFKRGK